VQSPNAEDTSIKFPEDGDKKNCSETDKDEIDETNPDDYDDQSNSNNTRTVTQQTDLVAPNEILVSAKPLFSLAEPVLIPSEQLRRLDSIIRAKLADKQKIVCDILRIPSEHFPEISDIAGQPEAPNQEPTDLILAAFAQIQTLTELLSEHLQTFAFPEISAASMLCDDCNKNLDSNIWNKEPVTTAKSSNKKLATVNADVKRTPSSASMKSNASVAGVMSIEQGQGIANKSTVITEDENGYCQIDELRLPAINNVSSIAPASPQPALPRHHQTTMNVLDNRNVEEFPEEDDGVKEQQSKPNESEAFLEELKREVYGESIKLYITSRNYILHCHWTF
jgi:Rho guanine nucleotide exchange factor 12